MLNKTNKKDQHLFPKLNLYHLLIISLKEKNTFKRIGCRILFVNCPQADDNVLNTP